MRIDPFDVLKKMTEDDCQEFKLFNNDNIKNVNVGKDGWGDIKIAIDSDSASKIMQDLVQYKLPKIKIALLVYPVDIYNETKRMLEEKNEN